MPLDLSNLSLLLLLVLLIIATYALEEGPPQQRPEDNADLNVRPSSKGHSPRSDSNQEED